MKRILTSDGTPCPTCKGRGLHGSILRGGLAQPLVCNTCDGYGRMRKTFEDDMIRLETLGEILTIEQVGLGTYGRVKAANDNS